MLASYSSVEKFLSSTVDTLGSGEAITDAKVSQIQHLKTVWDNEHKNHDDVTELMIKLKQPSMAFTDDDRKDLGKFAMGLMAGVSAGSLNKSNKSLQTCLSFNTCLGAPQWDKLSSTTDIDRRCDMTIEFGLGIGIKNPSEPTKVAMLVTACMAEPEINLTHSEFYSQLAKFTAIIDKKRKAHGWPDRPCITYPAYGKDLAITHPTLFASVPVESRIDNAVFDSRRRSFGSRSSQLVLRDHKPKGNTRLTIGDQSIGAVQPSSSMHNMQNMPMQNLPMQMQNPHLMMQMMQAMLNGGVPSQQETPLNITFTNRSGMRKNRTSLGLTDAMSDISTSPQESPRDSQDSPEYVLPETLAGGSTGVDKSGDGTECDASKCGGADATLDDIKHSIDKTFNDKKAKAKENRGKSATKAKGKGKGKGHGKGTKGGKGKNTNGDTSAKSGNNKSSGAKSGKGNARGKGDKGAKGGKDKAKQKLVLGCSKCRYIVGGCMVCRNPKFNGSRWNPHAV